MIKFHHHQRGSILIWTVMLGMALTIAFLALANRLGLNAESQQLTMEFQNQKAYLESYIGHLQAQDVAPGIYRFDGMEVMVSNTTDALEGWLDLNDSVSFSINDEVLIEWNVCVNNLKAHLAVDGDVKLHDGGSECAVGDPDYDDVFEKVASGTLELKSVTTPTQYRVTSKAGLPLMLGTKTFTGKAKLPNGKTLEVTR